MAQPWARDFYTVWSDFTTAKKFEWVAKWDVERGDDRSMRRLMEKENKKVREDYRKEYNDAVRVSMRSLRSDPSNWSSSSSIVTRDTKCTKLNLHKRRKVLPHLEMHHILMQRRGAQRRDCRRPPNSKNNRGRKLLSTPMIPMLRRHPEKRLNVWHVERHSSRKLAGPTTKGVKSTNKLSTGELILEVSSKPGCNKKC